MEQCQSLREYAQYVAKVREYARESDLDTAVEQAVDELYPEWGPCRIPPKTQIRGNSDEYIRV